MASGTDRVPELFVRTLSDLSPHRVDAARGARYPFFSPDGTRLGYFADGQLKVVDVETGAGRVLAPAPNARGGTWRDDDWIVFAPTTTDGLKCVPASGDGAVQALTTLRGDELGHVLPWALPGGRGLVFTARHASGVSSIETAGPTGRDATTLVQDGRSAKVAAGQIWFVNAREEVLAAPFDAATRAITGATAVQPERFGVFGNLGSFAFDLSATGTLVYEPFELPQRRLAIAGRDGRTVDLPGPPRAFAAPRVSWQDDRIAVGLSETTDWGDVWTGDLRGAFVPLTRDGTSRYGEWSPDGRRLVVESRRHGRGGLYVHTVGEPDTEAAPILEGDVFPRAWLRRGALLVVPYDASGAQAMSVVEPGATAPVQLPLPVRAPTYGRLSPDDRWLAYTNSESGQWEVYVVRVPFDGQVTSVTHGTHGDQPVWAKNGRELFFSRASGEIAAVAMGPDGPAGSPRAVGVTLPRLGQPGEPWWDTLSDGRFLFIRSLAPATPRITVVTGRLSASR
ncbi:MAG: hypothetical protein R2752_08215 [Vicinamibacterales bacterium]